MLTIGQEEFNILKKNDVHYLIEFGSETCMPCKAMARRLILLEKMHTNVGFYYIDVDKNPEMVEFFGVQSVPTVVVSRGDREIERSGSFEKIVRVINSL